MRVLPKPAHVVAAPERGEADAWLAGMRTIASVLDLPPR
jgi:hypothetical protein